MKKIKMIIILLIISILISLPVSVFADDEFEEEFDFTQMDEFMHTVNSEVQKVPTINSRHAVIYDRVTRKGVIWEKGK